MSDDHDSKEVHNFDQLAAKYRDTYPPLWKSLYDSCVKEGFNESQALELVKTFIISMGGNGTKV